MAVEPLLSTLLRRGGVPMEVPVRPVGLGSFSAKDWRIWGRKDFGTGILIHGEKVLREDVSIDTTVQEKNITFRTDTKLAKKVNDVFPKEVR